MAGQRRGSSKSNWSTTTNGTEDEPLDPDSFKAFAKENFAGQLPFHFTRKVIHNPVLQFTPSEDKKISIAIFQVILRFMGDQADYRSNMDMTYQPYLGPVMTRLYSRLGITPAQADLWRERTSTANGDINQNTTNESGPAMATLRKSKTGGTLKRMKATLTSRFFAKEHSFNTIWESLPLEETLMSPLEQIHFIIGCGIIKPTLRDEIYSQICKQVTDNPFKTSVARGWLLLGLVCATFAPTENIMNPLVHFLGKGPPFYSVNCKKALQRTLQNGPRHQPPSYMEMEEAHTSPSRGSYGSPIMDIIGKCYRVVLGFYWILSRAGLQKTMLEVSVTMMDGSLHALTVDGATTAKEFAAHLGENIGLNEQFGFSVYIAMLDKVASLGNGNDHLFDAISQCEQMYRDQENKEGVAPWRLFYRKELFSPWESSLSDPIATNLIFAQVVRGVMLGEYVCEQDNQLSMLAAQQYFIEYGTEISEDGLTALLPSYIPPEKLIDDDSLPKWKKQIVKTHEKLFANNPQRTPERVKQEVVHFAKTKWPMSFSRYYDIRKLEGPDWPDGELCLAVNWTGVYILHEGETIFEMAYPEITSITDGGSPTGHVIMFFVISGAAFKFNCKDGEDVRHLVDYMLNGLRKRSTFAIATESYQAESAGEISFHDGDLILLTDPAAASSGQEQASAVNEKTGDVGNVTLERIYRLATLARPSDDLLKLFQTQRNMSM